MRCRYTNQKVCVMLVLNNFYPTYPAELRRAISKVRVVATGFSDRRMEQDKCCSRRTTHLLLRRREPQSLFSWPREQRSKGRWLTDRPLVRRNARPTLARQKNIRRDR